MFKLVLPSWLVPEFDAVRECERVALRLLEQQPYGGDHPALIPDWRTASPAPDRLLRRVRPPLAGESVLVEERAC